MTTMHNNIIEMFIYISKMQPVMVDITPSSQRSCAEILKMTSMNWLCNWSSIGSAKPMWKSRRFPALARATHGNLQHS